MRYKSGTRCGRVRMKRHCSMFGMNLNLPWRKPRLSKSTPIHLRQRGLRRASSLSQCFQSRCAEVPCNINHSRLSQIVPTIATDDAHGASCLLNIKKPQLLHPKRSSRCPQNERIPPLIISRSDILTSQQWFSRLPEVPQPLFSTKIHHLLHSLQDGSLHSKRFHRRQRNNLLVGSGDKMNCPRIALTKPKSADRPASSMLGPFIYDTTSVVDRLHTGAVTPLLTAERLDEICRPLTLPRR